MAPAVAVMTLMTRPAMAPFNVCMRLYSKAAGRTKNAVAKMFMSEPTHSPRISPWMTAAIDPTAMPAPGPKANPQTIAGMREGS